jgi:hypothetical protein
VRLWLDDMRDPAAFGCHGYLWVKDYDQAIAALATGTFASLDHDLSIETAYNHNDCKNTYYTPLKYPHPLIQT